MAAPRVEEYVRELFQGSSISVEVVSDVKTIEKEYPLFAAVNRCANGKDSSIYFYLIETDDNFVQMLIDMLVE